MISYFNFFLILYETLSHRGEEITTKKGNLEGIQAAYRKWADHDFKKESGLHMICLTKESELHIESGQITAEAHPGAYEKKIKGDLITYQTRYNCILGEISK